MHKVARGYARTTKQLWKFHRVYTVTAKPSTFLVLGVKRQKPILSCIPTKALRVGIAKMSVLKTDIPIGDSLWSAQVTKNRSKKQFSNEQGRRGRRDLSRQASAIQPSKRFLLNRYHIIWLHLYNVKRKIVFFKTFFSPSFETSF